MSFPAFLFFKLKNWGGKTGKKVFPGVLIKNQNLLKGSKKKVAKEKEER